MVPPRLGRPLLPILAAAALLTGCAQPAASVVTVTPAVASPSTPGAPGSAPASSASTSTADDRPLVADDCRGIHVGRRIDADVRVRAGHTCTLRDVEVSGSVRLDRDAVLQGDNLRVAGDISADGHVEVRVVGGDIRGDVRLSDGGRAVLERLRVGGDVQLTGNRGNQVLDGVRVGGSLQCSGNEPAPSGGQNTVAGTKEDQCAEL